MRTCVYTIACVPCLFGLSVGSVNRRHPPPKKTPHQTNQPRNRNTRHHRPPMRRGQDPDGGDGRLHHPEGRGGALQHQRVGGAVEGRDVGMAVRVWMNGPKSRGTQAPTPVQPTDQPQNHCDTHERMNDRRSFGSSRPSTSASSSSSPPRRRSVRDCSDRGMIAIN